jgi:hypothetical protein
MFWFNFGFGFENPKPHPKSNFFWIPVSVQKQLSTKQLKRSHSLEEIIDSEKNEKTISKRNIDSLKSTNLIQTPILPTFKYQNSNRIEIDSSFSKLKIKGLLANYRTDSKNKGIFLFAHKIPSNKIYSHLQ